MAKNVKDVLDSHAARITKIERRQNSTYGNPSFHIHFDNGTSGTTKANAGWAYAIHPGMVGKSARYKLDKRGRISDLDGGK